MKIYSDEDLLLFLDVILTGQEFAEYSAEERTEMFRAIRRIVEDKRGKEADIYFLGKLKSALWLAVWASENHTVSIPAIDLASYEKKRMAIETSTDPVTGSFKIRAFKPKQNEEG